MPLDIGIGFLSALGAHAIFHAPLSAKLVLVGVGAALLPDIDILTAIAGNWRHRGLTHYPLTYLPLFAAAFLFAPFSYAALFTFGVLAHLVHDTVGTGWGISWLWPFTDRRFLLFPYQRQAEMGVFAVWLPQEHPEWAHHGPHAWIRSIYFRPSLVSVVEFGFLAAVLLTLLIYVW